MPLIWYWPGQRVLHHRVVLLNAEMNELAYFNHFIWNENVNDYNCTLPKLKTWTTPTVALLSGLWQSRFRFGRLPFLSAIASLNVNGRASKISLQPVSSAQASSSLYCLSKARRLAAKQGTNITFPYSQRDEPTMSLKTLALHLWKSAFSISDIGALSSKRWFRRKWKRHLRLAFIPQTFQTSYDAKFTAPLMLGGGQWSICALALMQCRGWRNNEEG